jgi:Xaa-Pro aminopeptidase
MLKIQTYLERRKKLIESFNSGLLLFLGNDESPMNYQDNPFDFRQDSSFLYFFGLDLPGLAAIIDIDQGREIIFGDDISVEMTVWMGSQQPLIEKCELAGIKELLPYAKLQEYVDQAKSRKIHFLPPYRGENMIKIQDLLAINPHKQSELASLDFIKEVINQRNYKSSEEMIEMHEAATITAEMHLTAMKFARPGMKEYEVAGKVIEVARSHNGMLSFPVICTINGQTLHNHYYGNTLKSGDMLLLDAGAENKNHYAGDYSHSFPVDQKFTQEQKEIYNISLNAHKAAVDKVAPGTKMKDVHFAAAASIVEDLKLLGLMKGDTQEAVVSGAYALFFQCGTGHMIGLDVHDMEDLGEQYVGYANPKEKETELFGLKSLRLGRVLEPGFVITIEPGIYFNPLLIEMWKAEQRFTEFINYDKAEDFQHRGGYRSEEMFLITSTGKELVGKDVPKEVAEVEAIRSESI